jgi:2-dehydro-3-deoxyphosphogluconate aldolase/(4S)-4-hydroxy-2-oxoglutarate aldolase
MLVGAGTVLSQAQADLALEAGASFAVAPASSYDVIRHCEGRGLPFFPGIATPSELDRAVGLGLSLVKVFPAAQVGGPGFLRAVSAVYPDVGFMPTGGISLENLADYLAVPSVVACGGSWLVPPDAVADGDYGRITQLAADAVERAAAKDASPA